MSTTKPPKGWRLNTNHAYANGLVGAWIWNEGSGQTTTDLTGISGIATAVGWTLVWGTNGDGQMSITIDTSDSTYISVANNVITALSQPMTVISKVTFGDINQAIVSFSDSSTTGDQHCLRTKAGGLLTAASRINGSGFSEAATVTGRTAPTIVTVAGVFNGLSSRILYVNGSQEGINTDTLAADKTLNVVNIGRLGDSTPNGSWGGGMEYLFLYNRALTGTEVANVSAGPYAMMAPPGRANKNVAAIRNSQMITQLRRGMKTGRRK